MCSKHFLPMQQIGTKWMVKIVSKFNNVKKIEI